MPVGQDDPDEGGELIGCDAGADNPVGQTGTTDYGHENGVASDEPEEDNKSLGQTGMTDYGSNENDIVAFGKNVIDVAQDDARVTDQVQSGHDSCLGQAKSQIYDA